MLLAPADDICSSHRRTGYFDGSFTVTNVVRETHQQNVCVMKTLLECVFYGSLHLKQSEAGC